MINKKKGGSIKIPNLLLLLIYLNFNQEYHLDPHNINVIMVFISLHAFFSLLVFKIYYAITSNLKFPYLIILICPQNYFSFNLFNFPLSPFAN